MVYVKSPSPLKQKEVPRMLIRTMMMTIIMMALWWFGYCQLTPRVGNGIRFWILFQEGVDFFILSRDSYGHLGNLFLLSPRASCNTFRFLKIQGISGKIIFSSAYPIKTHTLEFWQTCGDSHSRVFFGGHDRQVYQVYMIQWVKYVRIKHVRIEASS